jgi:hypothetical protein
MKNPGTNLVLLVMGTLVLAGGALAQDAAAPSVDIAFGTDIDRESRELVGETAVFAAGIEKITCLTRLKGLEAPTSVTHVWYRDGKTMARVDLNVASSNWRTWSSKRLLPDWTGHWEVKVLDSDGRILGSAGFDVQ